MKRGRRTRVAGVPPRDLLYHGTGASLLDAIRREGLRPDAPHTFGISRYAGPGIYATLDFDLACFFACDGAWRNCGDDAVVLAFALPPGTAVRGSYFLRPDLDDGHGGELSDQLPPDVVVPPSALYLWTERGWAPLSSTADDEAVILDCRDLLGDEVGDEE